MGTNNFQKYSRSTPWSLPFGSPGRARLWPVESLWKAQGRYKPCEQGFLRYKGCNLEDGEASDLLVSNYSMSVPRGSLLTLGRDAFTTSADFIISPHAAAKGLFIATCGNFHGYKFFPVLGKYIVKMLEGELSPELVQKWAWDRERPHSSVNPDYPRFEMKDLLDVERTSKL